MSDIILDRSIKELGEVIRLPSEDPRRQVTFDDDGVAPKLPAINRVGRPRAHGATMTRERIWNTINLDTVPFDVNNPNHLKIIQDATDAEVF